MFTSNIKNFENTKEINKEIDYEKRLCNLYGVCGTMLSGLGSHHITHFGLKRLSEQKA